MTDFRWRNFVAFQRSALNLKHDLNNYFNASTVKFIKKRYRYGWGKK